MATWEINKGVGRTVEFKGLKAQYLFLFIGGLLGVFILVVMLYLCSVNQLFCLALGLVGTTLIVWQTFTMNRRAIGLHPRYLINNRSIRHLFQQSSTLSSSL